MKILSISNSQSNNTYCQKTGEKSFTGLTKFLEKSVYAMPHKERSPKNS